MERGYAFENLGELKNILLELSDNLDSFSSTDTFSKLVISQFSKIKEITKKAYNERVLVKNELDTLSLDEVINNGFGELDHTERMSETIKFIFQESNRYIHAYGLSTFGYSPTWISCIYFILKNNDEIAEYLYATTLLPLVYSNEIKNIPSLLGSKGGRPEHPRKEEALKIARERWEKIPYASISSVASYVKSKLEEKYTDAPKLPSIKSWLNKANLKPIKK